MKANSVSTFTDNNQISIVGGANNTNDLGFMDSGRGRFASFGSNGGILTSQQLGLNFNVGKTDDFRVGGNVFYTHTDRHSTTDKNIEYHQPGRNEFKSESSVADDEGHNVQGDFRMEWKIDPYNTIDFRPKFTFNKRDSESWSESLLRQESFEGSPINAEKSRKFNHGTSYNAGGSLIFNHTFASRPGRSFSVQANYEFSNTRQHATTWSDIIYYMLADTDDADEFLYRFTDNHQWNNSVGGRLTWTEPLGDVKRGNFLQVAYRFSLRFNNANKDAYNIPELDYSGEFLPTDYASLPSDAIFDTDLSNRFRNKFTSQELQIGYKKVNKAYQLEAGMIFSPSSSGSEDLINSNRNIQTRWVWNVAPFARFRYRFSKTKAIRADYRARTSSPSLTQLQPVEDVSDPLHVTIGNPDLKPTFTQSMNVHFNNYNQSTQQAINAMIRLQYSQNVVVNRTVSDPETGKRTTTYANANGNFTGFGMFMVNQPLRNRKWRFSARGGVNYSSQAGYINGDFNRSGQLRLSPSAGMTFSCDVFQMSANPTYNFSMATNSLPGQENQYTHAYGFHADAALTLPFGLQLNTDLDYSKTSGYSAGFNTSTWLWNAQVSYSLLHDKSLTLSVRAYDILGQNKNISRSVSANGTITDSRYNDLTRYVMFGISYTFNTLKNKKGRQQPEEFDGPPMMGPPPGSGHHGSGRGPMGPPPGGFRH
ncbi:MAG: outer membrane beta-barrel family protein [Muribaculaceae bacterium]|nr:outer membrane beta-barrel family protein [Muribaculaceae bacterium]